ncbi:MAG: F0F1 ATP synthase subunit A [Candidatus Omnitrophica bacterium]|nr:F0F1 ATP synthase subunit A [Candidatus Omnitrophota bacterium]
MAVEATHHVAESTTHAAEAIPELPNLITLLSHRWHDIPWVAWLHQWENIVFSAGVALALCILTWRYSRRPATIPSGWQNFLELVVEGVDQFVGRVIGKEGRYFTPFIGTLFLYIWLMNLSVLVPFLKSSTSNLNTTAALAILVFSYVQWIGMRRLGLLGYLDHLAGQPRDLVGWLLVPLMLPIHLLGEFIKPLSLSLRLCFNVFAEDVLLAVMVGLGIGISVGMHLPSWAPVPLQLFVIPLVLIFSTVQALVFSLLSSVYIALMLPHAEHH